MLRVPLLALLLLAANLPACRASSQAPAGPPQTAAILAQAFAFPPPDHQTAAPHDTIVPGSERSADSDGAQVIGAVLSLPAGPLELEWGRYQLPTLGRPVLGIAVDFTVEGDSPWIGVSDYARGTWSFEQAGASPCTSAITPGNISPTGYVYIVVAAYNLSTTVVQQVRITLDLPEWHLSLVSDTPGLGTGVQLFTDGPSGWPCLVTASTYQTGIFFARALTAQPNGPDDWQMHGCTDGTSGNQVSGPLDGEFINGRPAVAYREVETKYLWYAYASSAEPESFADWTNVVVDGESGSLFLQTELCEIDFTPRITFTRVLPYAYRIAQCGTSTPLAGDFEVYAITSDWSAMGSLVAQGGKPAVCFAQSGGGLWTFQYGYPTSFWPTGPGQWSTHNFFTSGLINQGHTSLALIPRGAAQVPFVATQHSNTGQLRVHRALSAAPASIADWLPITFESDPCVSDVEVAAINGRAAVAYNQTTTRELIFAWAVDEEPEARADFEFCVVAGGSPEDNFGQVSLGEVDGWPVVAYRDEALDRLVFAYYE